MYSWNIQNDLEQEVPPVVRARVRPDAVGGDQHMSVGIDSYGRTVIGMVEGLALHVDLRGPDHPVPTETPNPTTAPREQ